MEKISRDDGFVLNTQSKIILYGASYIGKVTGTALLERGFSVIAFIDQRADEIQQCLGLPVYTISKAKEMLSPDSVIYVAVKNVFYHEEIAGNLREAGFQNLIYKTKEAINQNWSPNSRSLDQIYEAIYKKGQLVECRCPYFETDVQAVDFNNYVLSEEDQNMVILAPVALLYSGVTDSQWSDVPVLALVPYYEMFQGLFEGETKKIQPYLQLAKKGAWEENLETTKTWERSVIQGRYDVMKQMDNFYYTDKMFFLKNAPQVSLNEKGYFNLKTGKHRVAYLVMRGEQCIPVKIIKSDWEQVKKFFDFLIKSNSLMKKHNTPLFFNLSKDRNHNCYVENHFLKELFTTLFYEDIIKGKQGISEVEIIDQSGTAGYFYRFFSKMGVKCKVEYQFEEERQIFQILTEGETFSENVQEGNVKIVIQRADLHSGLDIKKYIAQM